MTDDRRMEGAFAAVPEEFYTHRPDGNLVRQSSSAKAIAAMLDRLDVRPGMRVLEIGTGSGFSGALLGELVGEDGLVASVDVMADLVERTRDLHTRRGANNIRVVTGDGAEGVPRFAPYDRIVAWASSDLLHRTWVDQCVPDAKLVIPITLAPIPRSNAIVRARRTREGTLEADRLWSGGFVEMHPEELTQWLVPPTGVHARTTDEEGHPWWISGARGDGDDRAETAQSLVEVMAAHARVEESLLDPEESAEDFHAYLYTTGSEGLSMFGMGTRGWSPGLTAGQGVAVALGDGRLLTAGPTAAARELRRWVRRWRQASRPGTAALIPDLDEVRDGWLVRPRVPAPTGC